MWSDDDVFFFFFLSLSTVLFFLMCSTPLSLGFYYCRFFFFFFFFFFFLRDFLRERGVFGVVGCDSSSVFVCFGVLRRISDLKSTTHFGIFVSTQREE